MNKKLTNRQKINAELAARATNTKNSKILKDHIPQNEQDNVQILFNCECADPGCEERVALTLQQYDQIHNKDGHFVVANGHAEPGIEKIKAVNDDIMVVEKFALS